MKTKLKGLMLLLPLVVTGCGGGKTDPKTTPTGGGKTTPTPVVTPTGGGDQPVKSVNIKFWHTFGQTIVDALTAKAKTFAQLVKDNDGVDVTVTLSYQGSYDDLAKKISDSYGVNNKPTLAVAYPDNVADYLEIGKSANDEFVVNLEKYINDSSVGFGKESWLGDKYDETDFVEDFYAEGSRYAVEGTYSLPYMKSTEIMFYNMDLLVKIMKTYKPEFENSHTKIKNYMDTLTWDEFMNITSFIAKNKESISKTLEIPFAYDSDANLFITKLFQEKIPYTTFNNGKATIEFGKEPNLSKTVSFLEDLNDAYHNGQMTTKGIRGTYGSDFFTGEKCVFSVGSSGGSGYNFPEAESFELGVCKVPASNNNPLYITQGPTLAIFNDNGLAKKVNDATTLYAWKFLKYITNGEVNADLCINGSEGYVPVRYSAYDTRTFETFMEAGENYAKCFDVVINQINVDCGYLVTDSFKGSAALRDECGTLLTAAIKADKSKIPSLIAEAISNASLKM